MAAGFKPRRVSVEMTYDEWKLLQECAAMAHKSEEDLAHGWLVWCMHEMDAGLRGEEAPPAK